MLVIHPIRFRPYITIGDWDHSSAKRLLSPIISNSTVLWSCISSFPHGGSTDSLHQMVKILASPMYYRFHCSQWRQSQTISGIPLTTIRCPYWSINPMESWYLIPPMDQRSRSLRSTCTLRIYRCGLPYTKPSCRPVDPKLLVSVHDTRAALMVCSLDLSLVQLLRWHFMPVCRE